ncbi:MAG: hypothetical protein O0X93_01550 [Methanocorpusculum sp.]|nr:hypothetical protein [Methanocorpusculum sp.]MDE2524823.1 hypothetical protein [Methanocorpusculum sp.]
MTENQSVFQRLGNALVHIVRCYPTFGRTQLVKTIFIADLVHSNLCGVLMFPSEYRRLPYGPASCCAMDITEMYSASPQPFLDITQATGGYNQYTYVPKVNEDLSGIPAYQLKILEAAACFVQSKERATDISEFTHKFSLWKDVEPNAIIPEERFQLNKEERFRLSTEAGISLTPFAQEFCMAVRVSTTPAEIEDILPELSCSYPEDPHWDKWLDAYLAWDSAMTFCCRSAPAMLDDLRAKGLDLVAGIACSGVDLERFQDVAIKYERYFNQVRETFTQKEEPVLSDTEEASVNSVMQAARCELGLNE